MERNIYLPSYNAALFTDLDIDLEASLRSATPVEGKELKEAVSCTLIIPSGSSTPLTTLY